MTGNEIREKFWSGNDIRSAFLRFFKERGHTIVPSSSLVPHGDPTLLFANAGMNQFKDVFLGLEQRRYKTATSCQKCLRAGGKHNDLENVGFTNRHHTFFEMLGNFSFGDYFKKDAIAYAWELVTSSKWFGISKEKLYVTIFEGATIPHADIPRDAEAYDSWRAQCVSPDRIFEFGMKENFWQMGETGPCGPCSEIHYDMGPAASDQGHADCKFPCECGRYVEIWNLVFMQFNRDSEGKLTALPKPCVDTGMGLERVAAVLQDKISNYGTDLFLPLMNRAAELCGVDFSAEQKIEEGKGGAASLRVISDHFRAATFLVADGVVPSNEGRGYVLRKVLRRAFLHGHYLNPDAFPYLSHLAGAVREVMNDAYPELMAAAPITSKVLDAEEERFHRIFSAGLKKFDEESLFTAQQAFHQKLFQIKDLGLEDECSYLGQLLGDSTKRVGDRVRSVSNILKARLGFTPKFSAVQAFRLSDTFGLPLDFIFEALRDAGLQVDQQELQHLLDQQRALARASWKGAHKEAASPVYAKLAETFKTEPDFYYGTEARDCHIEAIVTKNGQVNEIKAGTEAEVVLDRTVFYAESGGQVADTGAFYDNSESLQVAEVRGAYYPVTGLIAHRIVAKEDLRVGDRVAGVADAARRAHTMRNHTATHLMHAALRNILGTHVQQAGSLVAPDHLRFDFSHFTSVDADELREIEQQVNEEILRNIEIQTDITSLDQALASGALAFFGDKYPEQNVRVVTIPDAAAAGGFYSKELCGGTHVKHTGEIGVFKIVAEQSVAAGVRRVEAITGVRALAEFQKALASLRQIAAILNVGEDELAAAVERLALAGKQMEKQLDALKRKGALSKVDELLAQVRTVKDVRVLSAQVEGADREAMRQLVDTLRQRMGSGVVVLGTTEDGKVALISGVTKDLTGRLHAGKIIQAIAREVGGTGGGRPDLAEAGGKDTSALKRALDHVPGVVEGML